tara:strand:+ start:9982 stop:10590 length:609 start_codon:yes stop_codon:yes gene_type:complete
MPSLIIIAGCNGAGKSTFAKSLLPDNLESFDYDKTYLKNYNSLPDSDLREVFAKNKTTQSFTGSIKSALNNGIDYCYETNFDSHPIYWPEKFKKHNYKLKIFFFCIDNQEIARQRIKIRTEFKGHFVSDAVIDLKWKAGYKNINLHYPYFDEIQFIDNSKTGLLYQNILKIKAGKIELMADFLPEYFERRFPLIYKDFKSAI